MILLRRCVQVEPISNFGKDCGNKEIAGNQCVAGYVTLGDFSCNLCRNKIARQVAQKNVERNGTI